MSSSGKHRFHVWGALAAALSIAACANGQDYQSDDDDDEPIDARRVDAVQAVDAPLPIDAALPTDARLVDAPPVSIDASVPGTVPTGGACTLSPECAVAGDCCLFGENVCGPGMVLPPPLDTICFPE